MISLLGNDQFSCFDLINGWREKDCFTKTQILEKADSKKLNF